MLLPKDKAVASNRSALLGLYQDKAEVERMVKRRTKCGSWDKELREKVGIAKPGRHFGYSAREANCRIWVT